MQQRLRGDLDRHRQDLRPKIESALPLAELDGMRLSGFRSRLITNCLRTDQSAQRRGRASRGEMQPRAGMVVPAALRTPKPTNYNHYLHAGRGKFFWMADARRRRV